MNQTKRISGILYELHVAIRPHSLGYARVSGFQSARGEISIPDQKNRIVNWCTDRGHALRKMYVDEGKTATTDKRKGLQQMISDIEAGIYRPRYIVAYDTSRLFRNRVHSAQYENRLAKYGVSFISITQPFSQTVSGVLSKGLISELDQYIPMVTSVRVKETQIALAKQGFWPGGRTCFGVETYVVERFGKKVRRKLRPRESEAEIVRKMFDLSLNGSEFGGPAGVYKIAEWLRANEVTTRTGKYLSAQTVHSILTNKMYTGTYIWNFEAKERHFVEGDDDKEVFTFDLPLIPFAQVVTISGVPA